MAFPFDSTSTVQLRAACTRTLLQHFLPDFSCFFSHLIFFVAQRKSVVFFCCNLNVGFGGGISISSTGMKKKMMNWRIEDSTFSITASEDRDRQTETLIKKRGKGEREGNPPPPAPEEPINYLFAFFSDAKCTALVHCTVLQGHTINYVLYLTLLSVFVFVCSSAMSALISFSHHSRCWWWWSGSVCWAILLCGRCSRIGRRCCGRIAALFVSALCSLQLLLLSLLQVVFTVRNARPLHIFSLLRSSALVPARSFPL